MSDEFAAKLPGLLDKLYAAAVDVTAMPEFLAELSAIFNEGAGVVRLVSNDLSTASYAFGHQPEFINSFANYYAELNPITGSMLAQMPVGRVMFASDLIEADAMMRTEFYNDWMVPQEASAHHCGVVFERGEDGFSVMTVSPKSRDFEDNRDKYAAQLSQLVPHLARAAQIARLSRNPQVATAQTLDRFGLPTVVLTRAGRVSAANDAAELLLRRGDPIRQAANGRLLAQKPPESDALQRAIKDATASRSNQPHGPIRLTGTDSSYLCWLLPDQRSGFPHQALSASTEYTFMVLRPIQRPSPVDDRILLHPS